MALVTGILLRATQSAGDQLVRITFDHSGLKSLTYDGRDYLSYGVFNLSRADMGTAAGQTASPADLKAQTTVDPQTGTINCVYKWGAAQAVYRAEKNRLLINITVKNTSSSAIQAITYEPFRLRFPAKPAQFDGVIPILAENLSGPSILTMSTPVSTVVLTNEDLERPLLIGFPWAMNKPANTEFPLRVVTGREPMYPDILPSIHRPIPPGSSDVYRLALRFGTAGRSALDLAQDVYQRLTNAYPSTLHWEDRRPIGALILATANAGWPKNPRGWFLNPALNVEGPGGAQRFREPLLSWADRSIHLLEQMDAQGMVVWDIEGEQYPHPSTYVGDPRRLELWAPEMAPLADEFFKRFRDAGLRVGVTVRPQQIVLSADRKTATQENVADPAKLLTDKIRYAKKRWGATLFYVDSNGDPSFPLDARVLRQVAKENPGTLLIPEHSSLFYYSFSAPYQELRKGMVATPGLARSLYPKSFSVINTADGGLMERRRQLADAVRGGDSLMFRAWYSDPQNAIIHNLYTDKEMEKMHLK